MCNSWKKGNVQLLALIQIASIEAGGNEKFWKVAEYVLDKVKKVIDKRSDIYILENKLIAALSRTLKQKSLPPKCPL